MWGLPAQPLGQAVFAELLSTFGAPEPHSGTHFLVYSIDLGLCAVKSTPNISSYQGWEHTWAATSWAFQPTCISQNTQDPPAGKNLGLVEEDTLKARLDRA